MWGNRIGSQCNRIFNAMHDPPGQLFLNLKFLKTDRTLELVLCVGGGACVVVHMGGEWLLGG